MHNQRSAPGYPTSPLRLSRRGQSPVLPSSGPEVGPVSRDSVPCQGRASAAFPPSGQLSLCSRLCWGRLCVQDHTRSPPVYRGPRAATTSRSTWLLQREQASKRGEYVIPRERQVLATPLSGSIPPPWFSGECVNLQLPGEAGLCSLVDYA